MIKCTSCEELISPEAPTCPKCGQPAPGEPMGTASPKSRLATAALCFFVGLLGVHRFYVGKIGTGLFQLLTFGGLGIWAFIDFITILAGSFRDKQNRVIKTW